MKNCKFIFIFVLACTLVLSVVFAQEKADTAKVADEGSKERIGDLYVGQNYSYDRGNRRDPFKSLVVVGNTILGDDSDRIEGIEGCLVQELALQGIITTVEGPNALVIACDGKGYQIVAGTKLFNGVVLEVDFESRCVIFRQEVVDPLAIKPYTDVSKCLSLEEKTK